MIMTVDGDGTLIYDGNCGICRDSVAWVRHRLRDGARVRLVPSQEVEDLDALGLSRADVDAAAWWIDADGSAHGGHRAMARALRHCRGLWPVVGRSMTVWPLRIGANSLYGWIASNRHRLPRPGRSG